MCSLCSSPAIMFIPLSSSPPFRSPGQGTSWVSAWGIVDANSPLPCLCRGCVKIHQVQTGRETGSVICSGFQFSWSVLHSAVFVLFEGLVDQFKIHLIKLPDLVTGLMSEVLHPDPESYLVTERLCIVFLCGPIYGPKMWSHTTACQRPTVGRSNCL